MCRPPRSIYRLCDIAGLERHSPPLGVSALGLFLKFIGGEAEVTYTFHEIVSRRVLHLVEVDAMVRHETRHSTRVPLCMVEVRNFNGAGKRPHDRVISTRNFLSIRCYRHTL